MMHNRRRQLEARTRMHERWEREDTAPRLADEIVGLQKLRLDILERNDGLAVDSARHVRHIVVDQASAHFELPCSDANCEDGGHDLTYDIMRGLRERRVSFTGESPCRGHTNAHSCTRVLHFTASAEYQDG